MSDDYDPPEMGIQRSPNDPVRIAMKQGDIQGLKEALEAELLEALKRDVGSSRRARDAEDELERLSVAPEDVVAERVAKAKKILVEERAKRKGQKETTAVRKEIVAVIDANLTGAYELIHAEIDSLFRRQGENVSSDARKSRGRRYRGLKD